MLFTGCFDSKGTVDYFVFLERDPSVQADSSLIHRHSEQFWVWQQNEVQIWVEEVKGQRSRHPVSTEWWWDEHRRSLISSSFLFFVPMCFICISPSFCFTVCPPSLSLHIISLLSCSDHLPLTSSPVFFLLPFFFVFLSLPLSLYLPLFILLNRKKKNQITSCFSNLNTHTSCKTTKRL